MTHVRGDMIKEEITMSKRHRNYNQPVNENAAPVQERLTTDVNSKPNNIFGTVVGCERLNVRATPEGEILAVIDAGTTVEIKTNFEDDHWYAITTATGMDGYCKKEFINVIK